MKRTWPFVTGQQLLVPGVLFGFFGIWQWRTGALHLASIEGICRSLWPYVATVTVFWIWLCIAAGRDLNDTLNKERQSGPIIFRHDEKPVTYNKATLPGSSMAALFSLLSIVLFLAITYKSLMWVQPWEIRAFYPLAPDDSSASATAPLPHRMMSPRESRAQIGSQQIAAHAYGNLGERTLRLAEDIRTDFRLHGYWDDRYHAAALNMSDLNWELRWRARIEYFRKVFLPCVKEIRDEYASFHEVDDELDEEIKDISQSASVPSGLIPSPVFTDLVNRLDGLAKSINDH